MTNKQNYQTSELVNDLNNELSRLSIIKSVDNNNNELIMKQYKKIVNLAVILSERELITFPEFMDSLNDIYQDKMNLKI